MVENSSNALPGRSGFELAEWRLVRTERLERPERMEGGNPSADGGSRLSSEVRLDHCGSAARHAKFERGEVLAEKKVSVDSRLRCARLLPLPLGSGVLGPAPAQPDRRA